MHQILPCIAVADSGHCAVAVRMVSLGQAGPTTAPRRRRLFLISNHTRSTAYLLLVKVLVIAVMLLVMGLPVDSLQHPRDPWMAGPPRPRFHFITVSLQASPTRLYPASLQEAAMTPRHGRETRPVGRAGSVYTASGVAGGAWPQAQARLTSSVADS